MDGINLSVERLNRLAALRDIDWDRELRDPSGDTSSLSFVTGLVLGLIVGCVVALLLAPQAGRQAREQVWHTGIELRARGSRWRSHGNSRSPRTLVDEAEQSEVDLLRRLSEQEQA